MIDRGDDQAWPDELRQHLAQFRQGSLVETPPISYYANTNHPIWIASRDSSEPSNEELIELGGEAQAPYGMIATQDCDIEGDGAHKKPWVQLVPVYKLDNVDPRIPSVRRWEIRHLVPVTALGPEWVADLRIESAIEKSWLRTQTHEPGFAAMEDYALFSRHVRAYRGRPGLSDAVYRDVLVPLNGHILSLRTSRAELYDEFSAKTAQAYAAVDGDPLYPAAFSIVLVATEPFTLDLTESLDEWWESIGQLEYEVLPITYLTLDSTTSFRDRLPWIELDATRLSAS